VPSKQFGIPEEEAMKRKILLLVIAISLSGFTDCSTNDNSASQEKAIARLQRRIKRQTDPQKKQRLQHKLRKALRIKLRTSLRKRLCDAASCGVSERVALLLDAGVDPNYQESGRTPLDLAKLGGHVAVVKILLADERTDADAGAGYMMDGDSELARLSQVSGARARTKSAAQR